MTRAWIYQRQEHIREKGAQSSPWYVGWIDLERKQRSKSCGSGEEGLLRAATFKDHIETDATTRFLLETKNHGKRIRGMSAEQINALDGEEVVYFVEAVGVDRIKIGRTNQLPHRMRIIKAHCPLPLCLHVVVRGTSRLEASLHRKFAGFRLHGEWFQATVGLRALIREIKKSQTVNPVTIQSQKPCNDFKVLNG